MAKSVNDALDKTDDVTDRLDPALLLPQGVAFTHMFVLDIVGGGAYWATLAQVQAALIAPIQPNQLPTVSLALSANGIQLGASTTLTATAADPDGRIASVTFFDGATVLAALTTAPYTYVYTPTSIGSRNIRVVAIDNDGGSAQDSLPLVVVAGTPVMQPTPTISFPAIGNKTVGGLPSALNASSTNTVTPITYASSNNNVLEVRLDPAGWVAEPLAAGTATVTAYQVAGNGYNAANPVGQAVTVSGTAATVPGEPVIGTTTVGDAQLTANWQAPASNGGAAITAYKVYRDGSSTALATTGNVLSYLDQAVKNGDGHVYRVAAVNSVGEGNKSGPSATASAQPTAGWVVLTDTMRESSGVVFLPASAQRLRFAGNPNTAGNTLSLQITDSSDNSISYVSLPDDYKNQPFAFDRANGTTYTSTFPSTDLNFTA